MLGGLGRRDRTRRIELDIPRLGPGEEHVVEYDLPTTRRGAFDIGPAVVSRADPAGLLSREVAHTASQVLWVHPRWRLVRAPSAGFAKDLEGPTADDSPAGDIAFHAVRPYQYGDDPRHVHWMSSARAGQVMVRHYVDTRRPHVTVVVDGDPAHWAGAEFETGVEVAASVTVSLLHHRLPVATAIGTTWITGRTTPLADHDEALDRLTLSAPDADRAAARQRRRRAAPRAGHLGDPRGHGAGLGRRGAAHRVVRPTPRPRRGRRLLRRRHAPPCRPSPGRAPSAAPT